MDNWLVKMADAQPLQEQAFRSALGSLPPEELVEFSRESGLMSQTPRLDRLQGSIAAADTMGRELAQTQAAEIEKQANILGALGGLAAKAAPMMAKAAPAATKALNFAAKRPQVAAGLVGAGLGATVGAPRDPVTGQKQRLKGALYGGAIGAAAGHLGRNQISGLATKGVNKLDPNSLGNLAKSHGAPAAATGAAGMVPAQPHSSVLSEGMLNPGMAKTQAMPAVRPQGLDAYDEMMTSRGVPNTPGPNQRGFFGRQLDRIRGAGKPQPDMVQPGSVWSQPLQMQKAASMRKTASPLVAALIQLGQR